MTRQQTIAAGILTDTLFATRYFFKHRFNKKFVVGEHHIQICQALDKVFSGECKRLMILLPPRYSKTETAVKTTIAKGLALNAESKFIHLSYSKDLALDNSTEVKEIIQSEFYQELFPHIKIAKGEAVKHKWYTEQGGGVYTTSTGGQITGFGAGMVDELQEKQELDELLTDIESHSTFAGAIIIDDPIKPEDASSALLRDKVNMRFETTIRSRTNSRNTPIIIIMQRLHRNDLCGYLLETEAEDWTVLSLPALITDEQGNEKALWEFKHTVAELKKIQKANRFVFETQYQQNPQQINERLWLFAFNREKHTGNTQYNKAEPLYMSWDFNRNPMCVNLFQHYDDTVYGIESISIDDATVQKVCDYIDANYKDAFFIVTGDASGKNKTTVSHLDNYSIIKNYFNLSRGQMQYSASNPRLEDSRYFMNAIFEQQAIVFDAEKCKDAIFDFENVLADEENKPVKDSRGKKEQQSDHLDTVRYYFHRFFRDIIRFNRK